jgi:hypothetical protein
MVTNILDSPPAASSKSFTLTLALERKFDAEGYLIFPGAVGAEPLAELHELLLSEFGRARADGRLFAGGGLVSGHLNCFPGRASRFVYDELEARGVFDVVRGLSPTLLRTPNIGCNFNLPGSRAQNEHVDGLYSSPFFVVNVATVDTDLSNGAMEILRGTHRRHFKHWELAWKPPQRRRVLLRRGDALLRISTLWHRGMPNLGATARPMLAFTWEQGGTSVVDPYAASDGQIAFYPNRYATHLTGRVLERAFVMAPRVSKALRVVRSFFER